MIFLGGFQWFMYKGRKFTKYKEDKSVDDLLTYLHTKENAEMF